jgi:hypothetical protein
MQEFHTLLYCAWIDTYHRKLIAVRILTPLLDGIGGDPWLQKGVFNHGGNVGQGGGHRFWEKHDTIIEILFGKWVWWTSWCGQRRRVERFGRWG